jgi:hypothetical protein
VIVTEFQIDRFRDGQPLRVLDLGNGLNVAFVEDRLAQRTMLDVVPAVLYGKSVFHRADRGSSLPSTMAVRTDQGVFRIRRGNRAGDGETSGLWIKSPDGTEHESEFLKTLVDDVGQSRYERVFTFHTTRKWNDLRKRRAGTLKDIRRIACALRDATPALDVAPLPKVSTRPLHELQGTLAALTTSLADAAKQEQELKKQQPQEVETTRSVAELRASIEALEQSIQTLTHQRERIERDLSDTTLALEQSRLQGQLALLQRDLAALQEPIKTDVPLRRSKSNRTLEQLSERLGRCRQRRAELMEERKGLRQQLAGQARTGRVRELLPRIEATLLQEKFLLTEEQAMERLSDHIRELESRLDTNRFQTQTKQAEVSHQQTLARQALDEMDRYVEQFRRTKKEYMAVRERLSQTPKSIQVVPQPLAAVTPLLERDDEQTDLEFGEVRSEIGSRGVRQEDLQRERRQLEVELSELQSDRHSLDELLQRLYAEQLVPFRVLLWLGVPFMAGIAMIIYGMFLASDQTQWRFIGFGFAFALATAFLKMSLDQMNSGRLADTRRQVDEIDAEISELMERQDEISGQIERLGKEPEESKAPRRKKENRKRQRLANGALSSAITGNSGSAASQANPDYARLRTQGVELRRRYREMIRRWRDFLLTLELSPSLSPAQAKDQLTQRIAGPVEGQETPDRALEFQLKQLRNDLERRRAAYAQAVTSARSVVQELGFSVNGTSMIEQLNLLRESVQDYQEHSAGQQKLKGLLKKIQSREQRLQEYERRLGSERRDLQRVHRKAARQIQLQQQLRDEKARLLERERSALLDQLKQLQQRHGKNETIQELSQLSPGELDSRIENFVSQVELTRGELLQHVEQRGELREQLRIAQIKPASKPKATTPWRDILAQANAVVRDCEQVTQLTDEQVAALHRHQAPTIGARFLSVAADYLRRLTDGRWTAIELESETNDVVVVCGDERKLAGDLPDNELFDLLFSLWLTQLDWYAEQKIRLPIILEDPLGVTSHSPLSAAKVLRDFAATGHQLILATSSPEHAEWFADLEVPIANFAVHFGSTSSSDQTASRGRATRRKKRTRRSGRKASGAGAHPATHAAFEDAADVA